MDVVPSEEPIAGKCGARLRGEREGLFCENDPTQGLKRCKQHGGTVDSGRPPIHGRYSARIQRLKEALGTAFEEAVEDAELCRLDADVALFVAREAELLRRVSSGDTPEFRKGAWELWEAFRETMKGDDPDKLTEAITELEAFLRRGADRDGTWEMLQKNSERRAALAGKQISNVTALENTITLRQFAVLLGQVVDIVQRVGGDDLAFRVGQCIETELVGGLEGRQEPAALPPHSTA